MVPCLTSPLPTAKARLIRIGEEAEDRQKQMAGRGVASMGKRGHGRDGDGSNGNGGEIRSDSDLKSRTCIVDLVRIQRQNGVALRHCQLAERSHIKDFVRAQKLDQSEESKGALRIGHPRAHVRGSSKQPKQRIVPRPRCRNSPVRRAPTLAAPAAAKHRNTSVRSRG